MPTSPIPVVIVTGFLGSGKTTLLNHLLRNRSGARIAAIVNDFGSVNIDAMLIAGQVDAMLSLSNGCLCCSVHARGLDAMLAKLAQPGKIDLIVIEASGLAEPRDLIRLMVGSTHPGIAYQGLVEVVDAAEFRATVARHPVVAEHLKLADLIVLNKTDRLAEVEPLVRTVRTLAGGTPVLPTQHGRIDPGMLFDPPRRPRVRESQLSFEDLLVDDSGHEHHAHLHAEYQAVDYTTETPLDPRALLAFLADQPDGIYRIKGFAHFGVPGHGQKFRLHTVGGFVHFERGPWGRGEQPQTQLVLIGCGIDGPSVLERLRACEHISECALDGQSMLGILRSL